VSSEDIERVRDRCRALVRKRAAISAGVSVIPLPGVDVVADLSSFAVMVEEINKAFGLSPDQIDRLQPGPQTLGRVRGADQRRLVQRALDQGEVGAVAGVGRGAEADGDGGVGVAPGGADHQQRQVRPTGLAGQLVAEHFIQRGSERVLEEDQCARARIERSAQRIGVGNNLGRNPRLNEPRPDCRDV